MIGKRGYFRTSEAFFKKKEKERFKEKYVFANQKTKQPKNFPNRQWIIVGCIGFIILVSILDLKFHFRAWWAFLLVFIPIFLLVKLDEKEVDLFLTWVNQNLEKTHLKKIKWDHPLFSPSSLSTHEIKGSLKGNQVKLKRVFNITIQAGYRSRVKSKMNYSLITKIKLKKEFHLKEKSIGWKHCVGNSVDKIFKKRFELSGISASQLPMKFKDWAIHRLCPLNLSVKNHELTYGLKEPKIAPFYSNEGMILLLDDLIQVSKWLEESA